MTLLKTTKLSKVFGGLRAVSNFEMEINKGELVGLIGPNGAGKTTAFNLLTGVYEPTEGEIIFDGQSVVGLKPYQVTQKGIARTFQNIRLFSDMTVLDNVKVAYHFHMKYGLAEAVSRLGRYFGEEEDLEEQAIRFLEIFQLADKKDEVAKNLPYGEQRRLEIARALIREPKFVLLDEPFAGIDPLAVDDIQGLIIRLKERNIGIVISDHNVRETLNICDRAYIVYEGRAILNGTPEEIAVNPQARRVYLGEDFCL